MIPDDIISEIRSRADIVQVIGQHVQLKKAGRSFKGLCPFHGEKTPSFNVIPDKAFFHCFGCQKHGDVFTFVMELEGKSFVEAAEQLGQRFGVEVPRIEESPELRKARGERHAMLEINKLAAQFFREVLLDPARGEVGRAYLEKRGVGAEISEKFLLGYAPPDWHGLADFLKAKRADLELAAKLGLLAKQPRAGGYYDRFRDRLVCPVVVPGGQVHAFSARVVGKPPPAADGSEPPKYINSPESPVYKKGEHLFGLAQAREAMQQTGRAVLVEGNFDVISLHQAGFGEVVAPLGTALTPKQVTLLKRMAERVVLLYDGDKAGYKATMHALQTCVEADVEVLVASRPGHARSGGAGPLAGGVDPDSLVAGGGAEQLREAIKNAQGGIEFFCFEVWGKARANADAKTRAIEEVARLAAKIGNDTKREIVVDQFSKALDVAPNLVRNAIARASGHAPRQGGPQRHPNAPSGDGRAPENREKTPVAPPSEEVELLSLLADHPTLLATPEADNAFWLLTDPRLRDMYSAARDGRSLLEQTSTAVQNLPSPTIKALLSGRYVEAKDPSALLVQMTRALEHRKGELRKRDLEKQMQDAQRRGDRETARKLALMAEAIRKGDHELADRLATEISSNKKAE
ncbi:MAG: DNA primase [Deltaproteobacteria bacterium]|nr:DNA primase [Deltaproteobacteria bacterium]